MTTRARHRRDMKYRCSLPDCDADCRQVLSEGKRFPFSFLRPVCRGCPRSYSQGVEPLRGWECRPRLTRMRYRLGPKLSNFKNVEEKMVWAEMLGWNSNLEASEFSKILLYKSQARTQAVKINSLGKISPPRLASLIKAMRRSFSSLLRDGSFSQTTLTDWSVLLTRTFLQLWQSTWFLNDREKYPPT